MDTTSRRMIVVAVTVCGFAIGMAGLLNYFKYRTTAAQVVTQRLIVTGKAIENSIQSAIGLGLQFSEITTLQGILERERSADPLIVGIEVFDMGGSPMYSTDTLRASRRAPEAWLTATRKAGASHWTATDGVDSAAGLTVRDNFEQPIGILAIRYSASQVSNAAYKVGRELALISGLTFLVSALVAAFAVTRITQRLARDMAAVEAALAGTTPGEGTGHRAVGRQPGPAASVGGELGQALRRFLRTTDVVSRRIASARAKLQDGSSQR